MSDLKTTGLACSFIVGVHGEPPWEGFEQPCGRKDGTRPDPSQDRFDVGLCPMHWQLIFGGVSS